MAQASENQTTDYMRSLFRTARKHPGLWIVPLLSAVLIGVLAGMLGPKKWDSSQSFVVREELIGRIVSPGRFESLDRMKTAQEVIQESARRPAVLTRVLNTLGDSDTSASAIEDLQGQISFVAPGGAELGKTEILAMKVVAESSDQATKLVTALFDETQKEIRRIRQQRAESMLSEVSELVDLAKERQKETSDRMRSLETSVGGDLSELRSLNEPFSGGSELRRSMATIEQEIRQARQAEQEAAQLILYLNNVEPEQLLATPRELLASQPALQVLKNRLIEAQVIRSNSGGIYSENHPKHQAKTRSVSEIRKQINQELASAIVGLESQQQLAAHKIGMLSKRTDEIEERIGELAGMRVDYGQLVSEMNLRNEELRGAHKEFAQAESILRAANKVDLITRLDEPQPGIRPLGPGNKTILAGSILAGLLVGLGLIMMVTPAPNLLQTPQPPSQAYVQQSTAPTQSQPPLQSNTRKAGSAENVSPLTAPGKNEANSINVPVNEGGHANQDEHEPVIGNADSVLERVRQLTTATASDPRSREHIAESLDGGGDDKDTTESPRQSPVLSEPFANISDAFGQSQAGEAAASSTDSNLNQETKIDELDPLDDSSNLQQKKATVVTVDNIERLVRRPSFADAAKELEEEVTPPQLPASQPQSIEASNPTVSIEHLKVADAVQGSESVLDEQAPPSTREFITGVVSSLKKPAEPAIQEMTTGQGSNEPESKTIPEPFPGIKKPELHPPTELPIQEQVTGTQVLEPGEARELAGSQTQRVDPSSILSPNGGSSSSIEPTADFDQLLDAEPPRPNPTTQPVPSVSTIMAGPQAQAVSQTSVGITGTSKTDADNFHPSQVTGKKPEESGGGGFAIPDLSSLQNLEQQFEQHFNQPEQ